MQRITLRIATSNGALMPEPETESPQTMFYRFAGRPTLDIGGMYSANQFRKLFLGINPLYRLGMSQRFLSWMSLVLLIHKYGGYSCEDAAKFIEIIRGKEIRYAENEKGEKFFTLCKKKGAEEYCLVLSARKKLYFD